MTKIIVDKIKEASAVIQNLSSENEMLRQKNDDLSLEVKKLTLELMAAKRSKRSVDLAEAMFKKSMIPKQDIAIKAREIMEYDDRAFEILKEVVDSKPVDIEKQSFSIENEKDKISYGSYDRKVESRKKVEDTILKSAK